MNSLSRGLASLSVRYRSAVILLLLCISGMTVVGYTNPKLVRDMFTAPDEEQAVAPQFRRSDTSKSNNVAAARGVSPISLSGSDAVLVVEGEDFFTPQAVSALRKVADELEDLPQVRSVLWMDRVPILNIFGLSQPLLPREGALASRFASAKEKAMSHPLVGGQLLSDDATVQLMLVSFDFYHIHGNEDATALLRETAEKAVADDAETKLTFRVTGRMPSAIAALEAHESNLLKYQVIGYSMILIMALILFRGVRAVIIVALAPAIGVVWTLGIIKFFDYSNNPLIDVILPILVSLVGLTDGVHLMVQIRKLRASGLEKIEAVTQGLQQVGLACFLTSLTTAIGFGSLMLADSEWVQQFGLCSTAGVLLCFISVVTVIPLASMSWLGDKIHLGQENSLIDRNLSRIGGLIHIVLRYQKPVAACAIISTIALAGISLTLKPDQRQSDGLPQEAEATQALMHVDKKFGGLEFSRIDIFWNEQISSDAPEVLKVVNEVDDLLRKEELIGHPLSIRNLIDAQPGSGPAEERISLLELLPPPLKLAFFKPAERNATVTFRVQDLGIAAYGPVFQRIEAGLLAINERYPNFQATLDGDAVWRWKNLYQIVVDLAASLGTASIIILVVLAIVFRSIRLGLISIVPNLFPLAFTGAYLAFAGYNLEIVMVCNFTICLGIAVDDTIHFMTRFIEENAKTEDSHEAIQAAFTGVGTALIMTTAVLVAGFSIVTLSDARDHHIFAIMGALTIGAALFCDLVFLPALLAVFAAKRV